MHDHIQKEYGPLFYTGKIGNVSTGVTTATSKKLWHINQALVIMRSLPCQDPRCAGNERTVVECDLFEDETKGEVVDSILCRDRGFTVNDPVFFNVFMREMQRAHPSYPRSEEAIARGTKSITDVLNLVGIGPPADAHAHKASQYRGFRNTDPNKSHPDGARKHVVDGKYPNGKLPSSERDGLYFRRYDFSVDRVFTAARMHRYFKTTHAESLAEKHRANASVAAAVAAAALENTVVVVATPAPPPLGVVVAYVPPRRSLLELFEFELQLQDAQEYELEQERKNELFVGLGIDTFEMCQV
jgi:hypothetical protein